jgi:hypothetical protein
VVHVTKMTGFSSVDWIYYYSGYTFSLNYTYIQRYSSFTRFSDHRCTRSKILSPLVVSWQRISTQKLPQSHTLNVRHKSGLLFTRKLFTGRPPVFFCRYYSPLTNSLTHSISLIPFTSLIRISTEKSCAAVSHRELTLNKLQSLL